MSTGFTFPGPAVEEAEVMARIEGSAFCVSWSDADGLYYAVPAREENGMRCLELVRPPRVIYESYYL